MQLMEPSSDLAALMKYAVGMAVGFVLYDLIIIKDYHEVTTEKSPRFQISGLTRPQCVKE
jgi:hypothetical protein